MRKTISVYVDSEDVLTFFMQEFPACTESLGLGSKYLYWNAKSKFGTNMYTKEDIQLMKAFHDFLNNTLNLTMQTPLIRYLLSDIKLLKTAFSVPKKAIENSIKRFEMPPPTYNGFTIKTLKTVTHLTFDGVQ